MINKYKSMDKYWNKYNLSKDNLTKKIINYNNKFNINFLENGHFNHTRDLFALSLTSLKSRKNKINILDFGSNPLTLSNLNNKINTKKYNFTIFDPFYKKNNKSIKIKNIKYDISKNEKKITNNKYHLLHFASCIQYQKNFLEKIDDFNLDKTEIILFTYTPFSLGKKYSSKQSNHINLVQNVHSLKTLISKLKKKNFSLIFKSRNEDKYIACKTKRFETYSLNLIFKK